MRVALVPSAFWPAIGGVEEVTRRLADALVEVGDTVEVWAPTGGSQDSPARETLEGLTVRRFPMPLPSAKLVGAARTARQMVGAVYQLKRAVAEFCPDIVHVHCFGPNGAYATVVSWLAHVPLVLTLHGETVMDDHDIYQHSTTLRAALRLGLRRAGAVTACSAFTLADAKRFGLPPGKGRVIFNGVRMDEEIATSETTSGSPAPEPVPFSRYVLALGRVVDKKGFDLLLKAFAKLANARDVGLVIGGDGSSLASLRQLAAQLGLEEKVYFPGYLGRGRVAHLMRDAEVFVMPSRVEPFGIVVLEAWRAGTAVVATTHGGPPEFVEDGVDGLLADPFNSHDLADKLDKLLGDEGLRDAVANRGREKVKNFDWGKVARQYRDVYGGAILPRRGTLEAGRAR